jgi:hypothetical protein
MDPWCPAVFTFRIEVLGPQSLYPFPDVLGIINRRLDGGNTRGPHLIFVMMYAQDLLPFSILFTASFVQDGYGMLPLLSYSLKDSVLIKVFNLAFGLIAGGALFALGL